MTGLYLNMKCHFGCFGFQSAKARFPPRPVHWLAVLAVCRWHIQPHLSWHTPTLSVHLLKVSLTIWRLLRCSLAQWAEPACGWVRNKAENKVSWKKPACDPKMPKFIVNSNISKDEVPESFAGELTQQLSKALGKPVQVSPFAEMFSFFSQLCLYNGLFLSDSLDKLIQLMTHQYLQSSLWENIKYMFAVT